MLQTPAVRTGAATEPFVDFVDELKTQFPVQRRMILLQCPTFSFQSFRVETARNRGYYAYPPRGLQCLAASIEDFGIDVEIIDLNYLILEKLVHAVEGAPIDLNALLQQILEEHLPKAGVGSLVGVATGVIVPNVFGARTHPYIQTLAHCMELGKHIVLTGGPVATVEKRNILKLGLAHAVFTGEAENKIRYFAAALLGLEGVRATPGIYFPFGNEIKETKGPADFVKPEGDFIATYGQVPVEAYHTVGCLSPFSRMMGYELKYATSQLIRGCRGRCTFCELDDFRGIGIAQYAPQDVLAEIKFLVEERGIQHLEWVDDDLLAKRAATAEVLHGIIDSGWKISWAQNVGVVGCSLDRELVELMVESGCVGFKMGVESGSEEILKKVRKPASKRKLREVSRLLAEYPQLFVVGCYMIGFEDETYGQICETIRFAAELEFSWAMVSVLQVTTESNIDSDYELDLTGGDSGSNRDAVGPTTDPVVSRGKATSSVGDYLPSPTKSKEEERVLGQDKLLDARRVFNLPEDEIHSRELLGEIWFAFNLLVNYIDNKNLKPGGNTDYFTKWLEGLQLTYPSHPVMSLFLYLVHIVRGENETARKYLTQTRQLLSDSPYWRLRFDQYYLSGMVERPPEKPDEVHRELAGVKARYGVLEPQ